MQVLSVESPSAIERRLTISVPVLTIEQAFDKRIATIAKTASAKGFRPGKVPLNHVKQLYGQTARQEALSEVIQSSLYLALAQEKLSPVSTPLVEPKSIQPGQPLEFIATVEIMPEITDVKCELSEIEKEVTSLTDQDVESTIAKLREQNQKFHPSSQPAKEHDQVLVDFEGMLDGKAFDGGRAENYPIILGSKTMIPGFEDGLLGAKAGEERSIDITFPDNYFAEKVAGKKAQFKIHVKQVFNPELPELDETFIKRLGVKSGLVSDLQNEIRKNIQREIDRQTKTRLKSTVFSKLLDQNPVDVPKGLVEREATRLHDQLHPHHGHDHHHTEAENENFKSAAKQNVALGIVISAIVKKHNITLDNHRVDAHIQELASIYEQPEQVIEALKKDKARRAEAEMLILEEQVLEKLLEGVTVKEKKVSYTDFTKVKG